MSIISELTKIEDGDHLHIIDNKGYCKVCNKLVDSEKIQNNYNKIEKMLKIKKEDTNEISVNQINIIKINENNDYKKVLRYKRYKCFDLCNGRLSEKYRCCEFFETICYFPTCCIIFSITAFLAVVGIISYLSIYYLNSISVKSYLEYCDSTILCDGDKGLYCNLNSSKGVYEETCNCPGLGVINTCDCASSYYWDGLNCAPVYSYGEGDCSGDYSCYEGLFCDVYTLKCMCPDSKPIWNSKLKQCEYKYLGCFNYTQNPLLSYDFTTSEILFSTNVYSLEVDDCIDVCIALNKKYAHMIFLTYPRCACSNTYNMYSSPVNDFYCNIPCVYSNTIGTNRCPKNTQYSSFQIGL